MSSQKVKAVRLRIAIGFLDKFDRLRATSRYMENIVNATVLWDHAGDAYISGRVFRQ